MSEPTNQPYPGLERDVKELRHTVYGNGQPGIKTRVERIETQMQTGVKILWGLLALAIPSTLSVISIAIAYIK